MRIAFVILAQNWSRFGSSRSCRWVHATRQDTVLHSGRDRAIFDRVWRRIARTWQTEDGRRSTDAGKRTGVWCKSGNGGIKNRKQCVNYRAGVTARSCKRERRWKVEKWQSAGSPTSTAGDTRRPREAFKGVTWGRFTFASPWNHR